MPIVKLTVKDGMFTEVHGMDLVEQKSPRHIVANGWICDILDDGSIHCTATKEYSDGPKSMTYHIRPDGFARQTFREPGKNPKTIQKGFVVEKGTNVEGTIVLSGGLIPKRYVTFRTVEFQNFLNEHGITAVSYKDVKLRTEYELRQARYAGGVCKMKLETDGDIQKLSENHDQTEIFKQQRPGTTEYLYTEVFAIKNATWVILTKIQHEGDWNVHARILYTARNPLTLKLPKKE